MVRRIIRVLEQRHGSPRFWATLPFSARRVHKGQRFFLDDGEEVEFDCPYNSLLTPGQQLETEQGDIVEIIGEEEAVSVAMLRQSHPLLFGRACYILGVFHIPVELGRDWLRYPVNNQVDNKLAELGLEVHTERAIFCPDRDAFLYQNLIAAGRNHDGAVTVNSSLVADGYAQSYTQNAQYAAPLNRPVNPSGFPNEYPYQENYSYDPYRPNPSYVQPVPDYNDAVYVVQDPYGYDPNNSQYLPPQSNSGGFFRRILDDL
ncbi:urease accessory protein isoform 1 [Galdieria sulphuraria]|uniref:Urease accessory protein isoform 1 n=1 Tax=Galdieria sulphuraria TaxID=130081 RepID=M2Y703_GALSU|nr:urease accessory protein isoform 2 [Galdieria sulphuraria]XP_005708150.1 urease accessory protein isoform 1 [Galdieria sulphuraria]EME31629.1 urease accessory protein isoform 2 [Galdieria sulphuraria]EME31630.1 urease accessory protein isoform 1 [Galdieria sulphuraria]|eukprot:XP_005708149.1 urease accessory protein isoform 2 [Galdieria sulphuraria]